MCKIFQDDTSAKLWTFVFEIQKNISIENVRQQ